MSVASVSPTAAGANVTTSVQVAPDASVAAHVPPVPGAAPPLKPSGAASDAGATLVAWTPPVLVIVKA